MNKALPYTLLVISFFVVYSIISSGCAQIGAPTGGPKDTLPPVLVGAEPKMLTTNFTGNKIVLTFDEYVNVDNPQTNLLVSPYPKKNPSIIYKFKTITIKLKDTLLANTTYALDFGNAIKDVNEGNIFRNFTYVFSTGNTIDSLKIKGQVLMAQTGLPDSTLLVLLYRDATDSSVKKKKPNYIARVNGKGNFTFRNLPQGNFSIYAIRDQDGSKTYDSKTQEFAFADSTINTSTFTDKIKLYAYAEEEEPKKSTTSSGTKSSKDKAPKKFRYTRASGNQDLLNPFELDFSKTLKNIDSQKIVLTDTFYHRIKTKLTVDSTRKNIFINTHWAENTNYRLIIDTNAVSDSADEHLGKIDTIKFKTKLESEYGSILIRFTKIDYTKHPVLLLVQKDVIARSVPITSSEWSDPIFPPGEYDLRILYDINNNGKWDPGKYDEKLQPERVISLGKKLTIKADWDNESDIELPDY